jgi:hypothetical protein
VGRLAARQPARAVVQVRVTDPPADLLRQAEEAAQAAELLEGMAAVEGALVEGRAVTAAKRRARALARKVAEHYAPLTLQAAPAEQWEALLGRHTIVDEDGDEDTLGGGALPEMLALCAVPETPDDAALTDPEWWREQLGGWSSGEVAALRSAVLGVNAWRPSAALRALGKG